MAQLFRNRRHRLSEHSPDWVASHRSASTEQRYPPPCCAGRRRCSLYSVSRRKRCKAESSRRVSCGARRMAVSRPLNIASGLRAQSQSPQCHASVGGVPSVPIATMMIRSHVSAHSVFISALASPRPSRAPSLSPRRGCYWIRRCAARVTSRSETGMRYSVTSSARARTDGGMGAGARLRRHCARLGSQA
jgi:hypothetical protein